MADHDGELTGPDLAAQGAAIEDLADGAMLTGHYEGEAVLLARRGDDVFAIGATCGHYGGPLGEGVFDGACVRCPWHHARFDVTNGRAVAAPSLNSVTAYAVERRDGRVYVTGAVERSYRPPPLDAPPESVVVLGAGAAGGAAVDMLRDEGYEGPVTLVSAETEVPYDRPNLSKDYLAGNAPEEWIPLRSAEHYSERGIDLALGRRVARIDRASRVLAFEDGSTLGYGALLLATGAEPVRLDLPGGDQPHVHYLRSLADSRTIIRHIEGEGAPSHAVVLGASFIGLEVAASLRERGLEVTVVAPEALPMERVLGEDLGRFVRAIHEEHGVRFRLERTATAIGEHDVTLDDGERIEAGLVVIGVGVRPAIALAEAAGLEVDGGVLVDAQLRTSDPVIWAAGDIARWPDEHSGDRIRVEHWVVAQRQGQVAARNMLGRNDRFAEVPFFWSQHYDVPVNYVGHAESWDRLDVTGSAEGRDILVAFRRGGRTLALASIYRDVESLQAELAMERGDAAALEGLVPASR